MIFDDIFTKIIVNNGYKGTKKDIVVEKVVMNSNEAANNSLFFAIRGGNKFVVEALAKGSFVVYDDDTIEIPEKYENNVFLVENTVEFMQLVASQWRNLMNFKVVAITGSNGKTTVKDMVYTLLSKKYKGKKTEGNYNNHIGLPFTLLQSEFYDDFLVLEMGMSDFGEIELLSKLSTPDIGIITTIGDSHLEFLKTRKNVFIAKTEMLPYIKDTLIINDDDEYLTSINNFDDHNMIRVSKKDSEKNTDKNAQYEITLSTENKTVFTYSHYETVIKDIETNVIGEHNISNLALAISCAIKMRLSEEEIIEACKNIKLTEMRFQKIENNNIIYINDAYNASPISMEKSIETFSSLYNNKENELYINKKIIVLGDMFELGEEEEKFHRDLSKILIDTKYDVLLLHGERMKYLYYELKQNDSYSKDIYHFEDKTQISDYIKSISDNNEENQKLVVLVKGSRGMKMEEIIKTK